MSVGPSPKLLRRMSVEENIEVVRRFGEALTNRDWGAFNDLVAEDCEWTDVPSGERDAHRARRTGRERVERSRNAHWSTPARRRRYDEPTGRSFAHTGVGIVEVRNNQIVRYRDYFDEQTLTQQLDLD
jgi:ketosteroid isomerase-like protein